MITISYSELEDFRQCPHKHMLRYKEGWQKEETTGALYKGTAWHKVMEIHYTEIKENQITTDKIKAYLSTLDSELATLLWWMYQGHLEKYSYDNDWEILSVEHRSVVVLIPGKLQLGFTADLIIRWKGRIWIVDHKSCSQLPTTKDLDFHEQFTFYTWALRMLGIDVVGSIYSAARTKQNRGDIVPINQVTKAMKPQTLDQRFYRELMTRSQKECDAAAEDAKATAELMWSSANKGERHFNPDTCHWKCSYTEACLLGRKAGDNERTRQFLRDTGWLQIEGGRYDDA